MVVPLPLLVAEGWRVDHVGWELGESDETPEVVSVAGVTVEAVMHAL